MKFQISLLENALDELESIAIELNFYLDIWKDSKVSEKQKIFSLKRTIKHLSACSELVMKYRLLRSYGWREIVTKEMFTEEDFNSGNFISIGFDGAIKKLALHHIHYPFKDLKELHRYRNKLEHYGIDESLEKLVETLIGAIKELTEFCAYHVFAYVTNEEDVVTYRLILKELSKIREKITEMLDRGCFKSCSGK